MALRFYYGSGSPFAWKVWLALEHKQIEYELHILSFQGGDTKKPRYLEINPRGQVPSIVDDGFALFESSAILEYLEERFPAPSLLPKDPHARAVARRVAAEADAYLYGANRRMLAQTLFRPHGDGDPAEIEAARADIARELERFEHHLSSEYFAGPLSLADFAVFPHVQMIRRIEERAPVHGLGKLIGPKLAAWEKRITALPYLAKTTPPHWKA